MAASFPAILPSYGTKPSFSFRVNETSFGDGYRQISQDGINNKEGKWRVVFKDISTADKDTLINFIEARLGTDEILWTPPGSGTEGRFFCNKYDFEQRAADAFNVTLTLEISNNF